MDFQVTVAGSFAPENADEMTAYLHENARLLADESGATTCRVKIDGDTVDLPAKSDDD